MLFDQYKSAIALFVAVAIILNYVQTAKNDLSPNPSPPSPQPVPMGEGVKGDKSEAFVNWLRLEKTSQAQIGDHK